VLVALHAVMVMLDRGQKGKVAGLCLGGLCALCLAVRSKDMLMYHGLAGARAYLESKGLGVLDIGTAVVVYEALGFVLMVAFWLWCWVVQPVKLGLVQPFGEVLAGNQMVARVAAAYEGLVEKAGSKFGWVADRLKLDPTRLTTSFAEAAVARSLLKPLLLPLKLYAAYMFVKVWRDVGLNYMRASAEVA